MSPEISELEKLKIEEFHIGFKYLEWLHNGERYIGAKYEWRGM